MGGWLVDPINDQWLVWNHRVTRRTVSGIRRTTTTTLVFGIPLGRILCDFLQQRQWHHHKATEEPTRRSIRTTRTTQTTWSTTPKRLGSRVQKKSLCSGGNNHNTTSSQPMERRQRGLVIFLHVYVLPGYTTPRRLEFPRRCSPQPILRQGSRSTTCPATNKKIPGLCVAIRIGTRGRRQQTVD